MGSVALCISNCPQVAKLLDANDTQQIEAQLLGRLRCMCVDTHAPSLPGSAPSFRTSHLKNSSDYAPLQVGGSIRGGELAEPDRAPDPPAIKVGALGGIMLFCAMQLFVFCQTARRQCVCTSVFSAWLCKLVLFPHSQCLAHNTSLTHSLARTTPTSPRSPATSRSEVAPVGARLTGGALRGACFDRQTP